MGQTVEDDLLGTVLTTSMEYKLDGPDQTRLLPSLEEVTGFVFDELTATHRVLLLGLLTQSAIAFTGLVRLVRVHCWRRIYLYRRQ
jgi:hypothetical protein